ncbi:sodium-coupled monocarboxylate transporter 1 isoform X3 [Oreochromis niloticus]|uniref:sodium-coupled monocarboxylate transporter 1 isoform X3 n=1 Tax=Oreochromis niloticus TaxID=8128 RepID=UPI0009050C21|nr:sodium-coupled monocarboxylate transporter 1 isoform X3 [Oreochromis niloticus]
MCEDLTGADSLHIADYAVFVLMLLVSATIGLYYAKIGRGQPNAQEFLTGGRKLTALPVSLSLSLTASVLSSVLLISIPVEVYRYGAIIGYTCFGHFLAQVFTSEIFLPVFYRLPITSTFQYLELRYNKVTRLLVTFLTFIQTLLLSGLVIYAPALALNQVTGWNLWGVIVVTGILCTVYCALGGMKAVVWIDVFQVGVMLAGLLCVLFKCLLLGVSILSNSQQGGRLNFLDFDLNPLRRHTFWTIAFGGTLGWIMASGTSQTRVQRYNSCKSITHARTAVFISVVSYSLFLGSAVFSGLCLYSFYKDCDPWTAGQVSFSDQLLPYLVMDILKGYPGLPGLFLAAVYSGTLSTVSSIINTLAAVTVEDLIKPNVTLTDRQLLHISRALSCGIGVLCVSMAGLASLMGLLAQHLRFHFRCLSQARTIIGGVSGSPMFGLFVLGVHLPTPQAVCLGSLLRCL